MSEPQVTPPLPPAQPDVRSKSEGRLTVGVARASAGGERRVALTPDAAARLAGARIDVVVEAGAGTGAFFSDDDYLRGGAAIVPANELVDSVDVLVNVAGIPAQHMDRLHEGQTVIGMLQPLVDPQLARRLAERRVTAISLDGLPRTLGRAQSMDVLTSQANVAGYKAALLAANAFGRFFPLFITAAGTAKPADVLVLGAGVAGLQAMGTARRLGAVVTGYDVRPAAQDDIRSVGARALQLHSVTSGAGQGGYARALNEEEEIAQQEELNALLARFDVVITTAQVPGRRPPRLVSAAAIKQMRAGPVLVDLAASPLGGNIEGSVAERTVMTDNSVTIIGASNLPSRVPAAASGALSHNLTALLVYLAPQGILTIDTTDEIQAGVVVTRNGQVVHPGVAELLYGSAGSGGQS